MIAKVSRAGLQSLDANEISTSDYNPAKDTFACMRHMLEVGRCRLFPSVALVGFERKQSIVVPYTRDTTTRMFAGIPLCSSSLPQIRNFGNV